MSFIDDPEKKVILFLIGNPGSLNRHSTGHYILADLIKNFNAKQLVKNGLYSKTDFDSLTFVKSNSYMNESHKSLKKFLEIEKINLNSSILIILFDDFESILSSVKLSAFKKNESHNGVKSIHSFLLSHSLQNAIIFKLGIGIGPRPSNATKDTMASWVLSKFTQQEIEILNDKSLPLVYGYVDHILQNNGTIKAFNKLNAKMKKLYV